MRAQLGKLHLGAAVEEPFVHDPLVGKQPRRRRARRAQGPVLFREDAARRLFGDGEKPADREINDRRGHILGVRALVHEEAELRGTECVGRLVLRHDGLALSPVPSAVVPEVEEEGQAGDEDEDREPKERRLWVEERGDVFGIALDDRHGRAHDSFGERGHDRELFARQERAGRREVRLRSGVCAPSRVLRPDTALEAGHPLQAAGRVDHRCHALRPDVPLSAVYVPEELVVIGERVHRARHVVRDAVAPRAAHEHIWVPHLEHRIRPVVARLVGDRPSLCVANRPYGQPVDANVRGVVCVAHRDLPEDAVLLLRAEVDVDRLHYPKGRIGLDHDVRREALDRPTLVRRCRRCERQSQEKPADKAGRQEESLHRGYSYRNDEKIVARPRNERNPLTSVTVVSTIDDDCAGSCPSAFMMSGIDAPASPAMSIAITIALPITKVRPGDWLQMNTPIIVVPAIARPLRIPTPASLTMSRGQCWRRISRRASPRMVTASACIPLLPDCPATTGMSTARAVYFAIVPSNSPTTNAARNAVARLISSHGSRWRTANDTRESARSSLLTPTIVCMLIVASASAASTSARYRITPTRRWSESTTGSVATRCSVRYATISSRVAVAATATGVPRTRSLSFVSGVAVAISPSGTVPTSRPGPSVR